DGGVASLEVLGAQGEDLVHRDALQFGGAGEVLADEAPEVGLPGQLVGHRHERGARVGARRRVGDAERGQVEVDGALAGGEGVEVEVDDDGVCLAGGGRVGGQALG